MSNTEDSFTITIASNGIGGAAGAIQELISDAFRRNPSIASGLALAKMTVLSTGAEALTVAIAVKSGDPDRIGRASTAAIASIALSTIGAIGVGVFGLTGVVPVLGVMALGGIGSWLGKQIWEHYKESVVSGTAPEPIPVIPAGIGADDYWTIENHLGGLLSNEPIKETVNTKYKSSRLNSSPLILDLDGDGIEITPLSGALTFDHDADGVRTGTAWAGADDGLLVHDLDGNGLIDSGRELFGNNTVLANGQKAADGYAALRALDANTDGAVDAADAQFAGLRVWRDLDQDGVSDAGELLSLEEAGISQINLAKTAFSQTLADGTRLDGQASFVLNGQPHTYTDAWFAENPFYREFATAIDSTSSAGVLPDMQGSGAVRDLREAAVLSPALADLLSQFTAASTRDAQRALLNPILKAWAETSDFVTLSDWAAAGHTVTFDLYQLDAAQAAVWGERIAMLEAFNGQNYATLKATGTTNVWTGSTRQRLLTESWAALESSVYGALAVQTRLKPYLNRIELVIDEAGMRWDGSGLQALLAERHGTDARQALLDLADLSLHAEAPLAAAGVDAQALLRSWMAELPAGSSIPVELRAMDVGLGFGTAANDVLNGTTNADQLFGAGGDDELLGNGGDDALFGEDGNDLLRGAAGFDALDGGAGNDQLYGGNDHDVLRGGAGDDRLYGEAGNDMLHGGASNDYLNGGAGSDTYQFGRGDGRDEIHNPEYAADAGLSTQDTLQFLDGIDFDQLWFRRVNTNLEVSIIGTDDTVRLNSWYGSTPLRIDAFETSGGQTLLSSQVDQLVQAMAAFAPPAPGQITLSQDQRTALTPVLAASWV
jgi:RTX calcium-binding nonapeptide repeat (4 copies)